MRRLCVWTSYFAATVLGWCATLSSANATSSPELRILTEAFPPFQMIDESGALTGTSVERVQKGLSSAGISAQIELLPWARAYKLSLERPNTLIFSLARSSDREARFIWIEKLNTTRTWMYKLASNQALNIKAFDTNGDWFIGVERGDIAATHLFEQIDKSRFIISTNTSDSVRMLYSGRVDMVPTNAQQLEYYCVKIGCKVSDFTPLFELQGLVPDIYLAAHPDTDPIIINKLKAAFADPVTNSD